MSAIECAHATLISTPTKLSPFQIVTGHQLYALSQNEFLILKRILQLHITLKSL